MDNKIIGIFSNDLYIDRKECYLVKLKDPKDGSDAVYFWNSIKKQISEIHKFREKKKSWVVDKTVFNDGSAYVSNPIDPLFLILPSLFMYKDNEDYKSIHDFTYTLEYPMLSEIAVHVLTEECLLKVADSKEVDSTRVYHYNERKMLSWLREKVETLAKFLNESNIQEDECSSICETDEQWDACRLTAYKILSEYLSPDILDLLKDDLDLPDESNLNTSMSAVNNKENDASFDQSRDENEDDKTKPNHPKRTKSTISTPKPIKKPANQQSITAFFTKSPIIKSKDKK